MSQGIQFLDIVILAAVAGFLILRLRSVLGRRTGNEPPPRENPGWERRSEEAGEPSNPDNVIPLPTRSVTDEPPPAPGSLDAALVQIRMADPSFDPKSFASGARAAFEMIVEAFARGDRDALKPLLAPEVMADFDAVIRSREAEGQTLSTDVVGIRSAEIIQASLNHRTARVTVRFLSEQASALRDRTGAVIDGDPAKIDLITDEWTFARDTASRDPNWLLVATTAA